MSSFQCSEFTVRQTNSAMKVGTDAYLLGSLIKATNKKCGLDIGAGTGILSMMLAQRHADIRIDAIEIDEGSYQDCLYNFACSPWSKRLHVTHGDFMHFEFFSRYDLIFCNPPFYMSNNPNQDERKARSRHESSLPMQSLIAGISACCAPHTDVFLIVPASDLQTWQSAFIERDFFPVSITLISPIEGSEANRAVLHMRNKRDEEAIEIKRLSVRNSNREYTSEYLELTKPFYGKNLFGT